MNSRYRRELRTLRVLAAGPFPLLFALIAIPVGCGTESPERPLSPTLAQEPHAGAAPEQEGSDYPVEPGIYLDRESEWHPLTVYTRNSFNGLFFGTQGLRGADLQSCESPCRLLIAHMPMLDTTTLEQVFPVSQADHYRADGEASRRPVRVRALDEDLFELTVTVEGAPQIAAVIGSQGAYGVRAVFLVASRSRGDQ